MKAKRFKVITSILTALVMLAGVFTSSPVMADEVVKVVEKDRIKVVVFKISDYHYYLEDVDSSITKVKKEPDHYR